MVLGIFGRHRSEIVAYLPERDGKIRILFPVAEGPGAVASGLPMPMEK